MTSESSAGASRRISPAEIETAMEAPASVFATPEEVLEHSELTPAQKMEILRRWQYDAVELGVAVEEGMPGEDDGLLRRIMLALGALAGPVDVEHLGPTKQHGLPHAAIDETDSKRR
jgi:hypothetical protein